NDRSNIRRNNAGAEVVWDVDESLKIEVENFKKTTIDLVLVEHIPGYWQMGEASHKFEKKDAFTVEIPLTLQPETSGDKKTTVTLNYKRINVQNNEPATY
ncbi:MAG: hypothetical protein JWN25_1084, partial [Verrucomicrobiales bacterium]|nr:hypothetical protein [Verrucomicrobiales bacterium]